MKSRLLYPISLETIDGCRILDWGDIQFYHYENGDTFLCKGNDFHCLTGPAKIFDNGKNKQWWIEGKQFTEKEFEKYIKLKAFL